MIHKLFKIVPLAIGREMEWQFSLGAWLGETNDNPTNRLKKSTHGDPLAIPSNSINDPLALLTNSI